MADGGSAWLTLLGGPSSGQRLDIPTAGDLVVGSHPACALQIDAPGVESQHAVLRLSAGGVSIRDLGSPSGVFVNDEQAVGDGAVRAGDVVWLGQPGAQGSVGLQLGLPTVSPPGEGFFAADETVATAPPLGASASDEVFFVGDAPPAEASAVEEILVASEPTPAPPPAPAAPAAPAPGEDEVFLVGAAPAPPPAPSAVPAPPAPGEDEVIVAGEEVVEDLITQFAHGPVEGGAGGGANGQRGMEGAVVVGQRVSRVDEGVVGAANHAVGSEDGVSEPGAKLVLPRFEDGAGIKLRRHLFKSDCWIRFRWCTAR